MSSLIDSPFSSIPLAASSAWQTRCVSTSFLDCFIFVLRFRQQSVSSSCKFQNIVDLSVSSSCDIRVIALLCAVNSISAMTIEPSAVVAKSAFSSKVIRIQEMRPL